MDALHPTLFLLLALTWGIVAVTLFAGLYVILIQVIFHAPPDGAQDVWDWRFTLAQLAALTTVLGAMIALPITINRLILTRRQTDTVEQGHITDRINKAVEGLGAQKTVKRQRRRQNGRLAYAMGDNNEPDYSKPIMEEITQSNLEVRIGAIYALERISQDSARDHIQIMEILCAYIRQNAGREDVPLPEGEPTPEEWRAWSSQGLEYPRLDVDVALKVIERRGEDGKRLEKDRDEPYRLGLERACLRKIELSRRDLTNADLEEAQFQGANLRFAKLCGVNLALAELQGADLRHADLRGADLSFANLDGARLDRARFDHETDLNQAKLRGATLRFANYASIRQLTDHLKDMFGDASVILPGGFGPKHESWPQHWPKFKLNDSQFEGEWRDWLANPDTYKPPEQLKN
ncbi:pentapeptide repeat-containing protein [Roseovarius sp.]|uniref:pentapeptide repeat-containing protein n=1 Tax=Roseovarius sp. TaxID=1486281 RepID=UPI003A96983A